MATVLERDITYALHRLRLARTENNERAAGIYQRRIDELLDRFAATRR